MLFADVAALWSQGLSPAKADAAPDAGNGLEAQMAALRGHLAASAGAGSRTQGHLSALSEQLGTADRILTALAEHTPPRVAKPGVASPVSSHAASQQRRPDMACEDSDPDSPSFAADFQARPADTPWQPSATSRETAQRGGQASAQSRAEHEQHQGSAEVPQGRDRVLQASMEQQYLQGGSPTQAAAATARRWLRSQRMLGTLRRPRVAEQSLSY